MKSLFSLLMTISFSVACFADYTYTVEDGDDLTEISLINNQSFLMTGGYVGNITLFDQSTASFQNDIPEYEFTTYFLNMYNQSQAEINGGRIYTCKSYLDTTINVYGGELGWIIGEDNSNVSIYGGNIYDYLKAGEGTPAFHIYGYNFTVENQEYRDLLTGHWSDGSEFNIFLYRDWSTGINTVNYIHLHEIPEPVTFIFLAFGTALMRWKK